MSFSSEVKAELCRTALSRRCCAQAEAYGVLLYCNQFTASQVRISTESTAFAARLPALFHRAFQLSFDRTPEEGAAKRIFSITEPDKLSALWSAFGHEPAGTLAHHINFAVLEEEHCRLAFFRGAFLAGGSVTDPAKRYHLELSTPHLSVSRELRALLLECGFTPKETTRKANSITYFKQSEAIEDFLTAIGAPLAAMEIMNVVFSICGGIVQSVMSGMGGMVAAGVTVPQEMVDAIENVGFLASIPLWLVAMLGNLFITVMSFILIMTVYGRFFRLYIFTALAPIPLATFAGEGTSFAGKQFIKSYIGVCMEGAVIVLACLIFSAFMSSGSPVLDTNLTPVVMAWQYIAETIFNMLVLVGVVKGAERIVRELFGL